MAVRLHVAAARNTTEESFRAAFTGKFGERFEGARIESGGGWHWFTGSVWTVSGSELDEALQELPGPCLRVTTEDACRWYLLLYAEGQERYALCHEFSVLERPEREGADSEEDDEDEGWWEAVAFLADDESDNLTTPPTAAEEIIGEYRDMGCPLPGSVAEALQGLSEREALRVVGRHLAENTADALERFGIPHDREAVIGCLTGTTVEERELWGDIGNLPRFLMALGFGGSWEEALKGQLEPEEEAEECELDHGEEERAAAAEDAKAREDVAKAYARAAEVEPEPVAGGPVVVPVEEALGLQTVAWACGEYVATVLTARLPEGAAVGAEPRHDHMAWVREEEGVVTISSGYALPIAWDRGFDELHPILRALPDGTKLEVATVAQLDEDEEEGPKEQAAAHVYRGSVEGARWRIGEAYPVVEAATLESALELVGQLRDGGGIEAATEAEADAVVAAVRQQPLYAGVYVRRDGLRLSLETELDLPTLALMFFRHRYSDTWDLESWAVEQQAQFEDLMEFMPDVATLEPGEVILEGKQAVFHRADIAELDEAHSAAVEEATSELQRLGFECLGDATASVAQGVLLRGYAGDDGVTYGMSLQAVDGQHYTDLYSRFADGSSLTTTTNYDAEARPDVGIFMRVYEDLDRPALLEKHRDGLRRFQEHRGTQPIPAEPTLEGLAEAIDEWLVRNASDSRGFDVVTLSL